MLNFRQIHKLLFNFLLLYPSKSKIIFVKHNFEICMSKILITFIIAILIVFGGIFMDLSSKQETNIKNGNIYQFTAKTIDGEEKSLAEYKGKVLLIVNVASKCGFTKQYTGLQELYEKYKDKGFEILAFPCNQFGGQEPGTNEEIKEFCTSNFNVTFQLFDKIDVNGDNAHPLYKYLTSQISGFITDAIKWNFTKFLVDKKGNVIQRFAPQTEPKSIAEQIEKLLKS